MTITTTASQLEPEVAVPKTLGVGLGNPVGVGCIDVSDTAAKTPDSPAGNVDPTGEGEVRGGEDGLGVGDNLGVGVPACNAFGVANAGRGVGVGVGLGVGVGVGVGVGEGKTF